jgi:hypothetical protein
MRTRRIDGESPQAACATRLDLVDAAADNTTSREAELLKRLCRTCPIATDCLMNAMNSHQHEWGIWGATTPYTRTQHGAISRADDPRPRRRAR